MRPNLLNCGPKTQPLPTTNTLITRKKQMFLIFLIIVAYGTSWGALDPFVINRIRVGKQFRHMRHKKFLIFGGSLRFQIIFQFSETLWWSRTSLLLIISRYALHTEYKSFFSNLHVALSTRTDCKRGVCRIWFDVSALNIYRMKFSFHSFVFGLKRWPTVRASHMISLPACDKHLLLQELILFQIWSLTNLKVAFLLLPIIDGRPRYFPVPKTCFTPRVVAIRFWQSVGEKILKNKW